MNSEELQKLLKELEALKVQNVLAESKVKAAESKAESECLARQEAESKAESECLARQAADLARQEAESKAESECLARQAAESKAESECLARQAAESKAESECLARQEAESKAKSERLARDGLAWATLSDLKTESRNLRLQDEAIAKAKDLALRVNHFFLQYCPDDVECKTLRVSTGVNRANLSNFFPCDIFGTTKSAEQIAHLVPQGSECHNHWIPFLRVFANIFGNTDADSQRLKMFLTGYSPLEGRNRLSYTGLIHLPWNHVLLQSQIHFLDTKPSVLFVPLMPLEELYSWNEEGYLCAVIAADATTFKGIGATTPSMYETDISRKDPILIEGFKAFAEIAVILVDLMRWSHDSALPDTPAKLCESLYKHLVKCSTLPVPAVNESIDTPFRLIQFGKAATPQPGKQFLHESVNSTLHPAPHPLLLAARSMNTWLSFLYRNRELDEYPFLKGMPVDEKNIKAHSCVLFPSCSDVCETPNCTFCLASYVLEHQSEIGLKVGDCDLLHEIELGSEGGDVLERIALQLEKPCFQAAEADSCMCQAADDSKPGVGPAGIPLEPSSPGAAMSSKSSPDSSPEEKTFSTCGSTLIGLL